MTENNSINCVANETAEQFHSKWETDTKQSIYFLASISIIICVTCFTMIAGVSFKLILISLLPIAIIIAAFIYVPLFVRNQYINGMLKKVTVTHKIIDIETFDWFYYKPIRTSSNLDLISVTRMAEDSFFKGKKVWILKANAIDIYVVEEFFENSKELMSVILRK